MPGRTLPAKHTKPLPLSLVNLHVTGKQHLLGRDGSSVPAVCEDLVGLHATSNTTPYLSLFNRIAAFQVKDLERELYLSKHLVRIRGIRGTFFLVTRRQLPVIAKATQAPQERILRSLARWGVQYREFQSLSKQIIRIVSRGPKTAPEIKKEIPPALLKGLTLQQGRRIIRRSNLNEVLNLLVLQRRVWSRTEPLQWERVSWDGYGSRFFESMTRVVYSIGQEEELDSPTSDEAKARLAEMYILRYGPVTFEDVAWWMGESRAAVEQLLKPFKGQLLAVRIRGLPQEFLLHETDFQNLQNAKADETLVRFLPYEDPYAKGFKLKERVIPSRLERLVYTMGNALPTVLVDGMVVGTWSTTVNEQGLQLNVGKLVPLNNSLKARIQEEGQNMGKFLMRDARVTVSIRAGRTSKWQSISLSVRPSSRSTITSRARARNGRSSATTT